MNRKYGPRIGDRERMFDVSNNRSGDDVFMTDLVMGVSTFYEPDIHPM